MENKILNKNISVSVLGVENHEEFLNKIKNYNMKNPDKNVIIHYDVMDKNFVSGRGVDFEKMKLAKKYNLFADVHLMVQNPMSYIDKAIKYGAQSITVHYEIENLCEVLTHLEKLKIQGKIQNIGLAIKPETDIKLLSEYFYLIDMILVMSVEPGYGGQTYIEDVNKKIIFLEQYAKIIQVDGGVNLDTIEMPLKYGVTSFVVGSYITKNIEETEEKLDKLSKIIY